MGNGHTYRLRTTPFRRDAVKYHPPRTRRWKIPLASEFPDQPCLPPQALQFEDFVQLNDVRPDWVNFGSFSQFPGKDFGGQWPEFSEKPETV